MAVGIAREVSVVHGRMIALMFGHVKSTYDLKIAVTEEQGN